MCCGIKDKKNYFCDKSENYEYKSVSSSQAGVRDSP